MPDDNGAGGTLTFEFAKPVLFSDIGLLDILAGTDQQKMIFTYEGGAVETFSYRSISHRSGEVLVPGRDHGDNAVTRVIVNKRNVRKVDVFFKYSGAVGELNFCPSCS